MEIWRKAEGEMMLFSIIVPIYGVEDYLPACIDSVLSQELRDFELLLVDDGSPDRCPAICDEYARKDIRVRVIHQKNGGTSDARNAGLCAAQGEYVIFVDGDDVLCAETLQRLSKCIQKNNGPDMVIGNIIYWEEGHEWIEIDNRIFGALRAGEDIRALSEHFAERDAQLPWEACHTVWRRKLLTDNCLFFQKGLVCAEDLEFYLRVIQYAANYVLTDIPLIKYRKREDSIMNAPTAASVMGQLEVFTDAATQADIFPDVGLMRSYFANRYAKLILCITFLIRREDRDICYRFVEEHWWILSFTNGFQYSIAKTIWRVFGIRRGSELLNIGKKMVQLKKRWRKQLRWKLENYRERVEHYGLQSKRNRRRRK